MEPSVVNLWKTPPPLSSCQNLSTIFGAEILTTRQVDELGGEASGEILVERVEEFFGGEPGLIGADEHGQILRHCAGFH